MFRTEPVRMIAGIHIAVALILGWLLQAPGLVMMFAWIWFTLVQTIVLRITVWSPETVEEYLLDAETVLPSEKERRAARKEAKK